MGAFWSLKLLPMVPNVTFSGYGFVPLLPGARTATPFVARTLWSWDLATPGIRRQTDITSLVTAEEDDTTVEANKYSVEQPNATSLMGLETPKDGSFDNRIFSCLVISPPGRPINEFKSVREFLEACRDFIKAHRSLYYDGKILHRDISENNIIVTDAEGKGDPRGMLIDLDFHASPHDNTTPVTTIFTLPNACDLPGYFLTDVFPFLLYVLLVPRSSCDIKTMPCPYPAVNIAVAWHVDSCLRRQMRDKTTSLKPSP